MNSAEDLVKSWKNEKKKKVHLVFMLNSQRQERFLFFPILIHSVSFESVVSPLVPKTKKKQNPKRTSSLQTRGRVQRKKRERGALGTYRKRKRKDSERVAKLRRCSVWAE